MGLELGPLHKHYSVQLVFLVELLTVGGEVSLNLFLALWTLIHLPGYLVHPLYKGLCLIIFNAGVWLISLGGLLFFFFFSKESEAKWV